MRPCPRWAGGKDPFVPNMGPGHKQVGKGSSMIRDSTDKNPGDLRPSSHRHREPLQGGIASYHISILLWQHNHTCWRASYQDYLSGGSLQTSQMSHWHCVERRYAPLILGHSRFAWWETLKCSDFMYIYDKPWLHNLTAFYRTFSSKHHTPWPLILLLVQTSISFPPKCCLFTSFLWSPPWSSTTEEDGSKL